MSATEIKVPCGDEKAMRALIGRQVRYLGKLYTVTDVLAEDDLLILSSHDGTGVQEDCYGRPSRMVPNQKDLRFRDAEQKPTCVWDDLVFMDGPLA